MPIKNERYKKYDSYVHSPSSSRRIPTTLHPVSPIQPIRNSPAEKPIVSSVNRKTTSITASHGLFSDIKTPQAPPLKPAHKTINKPLSSALPIASTVKTKPLISPVNKNPNTKQKKNFPGQKLFYAIASFVLITSLGLSMYAFVLNKRAHTVVGEVASASSSLDEQGVAQGTGSEPSSEKPSERAFSSYQVSPERPRYLRIPSKSVNARVKELGLTKTGAIDAPWNIHDVGWYNGSITPGSKNGVSLLLGHVSGKTMPGVFKSISELSVGEAVEIEKGSGETLKYKVDKIETYDTNSIDMSKILYEVDKGNQSLRLMTCAGRYDSSKRAYESRTVVYTSPVK
jgi:LPXTG-site transpeptidase (sortase) family protein